MQKTQVKKIMGMKIQQKILGLWFGYLVFWCQKKWICLEKRKCNKWQTIRIARLCSLYFTNLDALMIIDKF